MPAMDVVDYKVFGDDMQYVEVELDPGEAALAEAGAMMYMEDGVGMETIFGDGSSAQSGFLDDMQYVEVELDPGEAALAEAGAMMYMEDGVGMETIFGDGSSAQSGFLD